MRDIRGDLKDRAEALEREIKASQARFDELDRAAQTGT